MPFLLNKFVPISEDNISLTLKKMKANRLLLIITLLLSVQIQSQVTIGSGKPPESYSVLELDSKGGGIRLNQLNLSEKDAVKNKLQNGTNQNLTNGLTIFDTEANKIQYWDGDKWAQTLSVEANEQAEGLDGQFLMSNGTGKYPEWTTLNIPKVQTGDFYLHSSTVKTDLNGVDLPLTANYYEKYEEDLILNGTSKNWVEIKGLETKINIPDIPRKPDDPGDKIYTRLAIEMQTGAQMEIGPDEAQIEVTNLYDNKKKIMMLRDNAWISFTIGIFIGNDKDGYKLKQVRSTKLEGAARFSFGIFTVLGAVDNLPPGEQTIKVAVKRRAQANFVLTAPVGETLLTIGKPVPGADNYNSFMAQSFLRANLYVIYD